MAITTKDELLGTWVFNEEITSVGFSSFGVSFMFNSNGKVWEGINFISSKLPSMSYYNFDSNAPIYDERGWANQIYRTIEITDVSTIQETENIITSFMNTNATKQTPKLISLDNLKAFKQKCDEVYKYTLPQASENKLGGIKAKAKTTEDNEVVIDTASGKLYVASDKVSVNGFEAGNNITIGKSETGDKLKISLSDNVLTTDDLGIPNGVVPLNDQSQIDSTYLPSYVDDVIEGYLYNGQFYEENTHATLITASPSKIYVDLATNKTYRWSGTQYVEISESLALGETSTTAYAGNKGKANADNIIALQTSKQDKLESGKNIKTINGESILGEGEITITIPTVDYATTQDIASLFNK